MPLTKDVIGRIVGTSHPSALLIREDTGNIHDCGKLSTAGSSPAPMQSSTSAGIAAARNRAGALNVV